MEEVDMDGSESDQELTGNETDESEWASKVHEHVWSISFFNNRAHIIQDYTFCFKCKEVCF
jgi:hypothetical protein